MAMNVICLAIDRLHIGYLGAYGNTWISTPNFDRLAAESVIFDQMAIDSSSVDYLYRSLWLGLHAMCPATRTDGRQSLPAAFSGAGWQTRLLTDDREVANHPLAEGFMERVMVGVAGGVEGRASRIVADELAEIEAATFFAAANECVESATAPFFLWLHTGTLDRVWDAPLEFREQYTDEDDPPAGDSAEVPNRMLPNDFDPDERVAISHAYAGQVSAIDQLLGSLLETIDRLGLAESTVISLFSPRGFPLGEHRRLGRCDEALYAELTHVPWLLRLPAGEAGGQRRQEIVQPGELPATMLDLAGLNPWTATTATGIGAGRSVVPLIRGGQVSEFDRACAIGPQHQRRIVTPAWSLRVSEPNASVRELQEQAPPESESAIQAQRFALFARPDDWYEINEVGNRCREIADRLQIVLDDFQRGCERETPAVLADLPAELVNWIE
jgi:arylsulfatase A-like enzyme